jgi:ribonuclease E
VASILIGPGADRLMEIEEQTKRRFLLEAKPDVHLDHFLVLGQGKLESLRPEPALEEGKALEVKLVEVGLYDPTAGVGTVNGTTVSVGNAAPLVGKKVKARIERVVGDEAYASIVSRAAVAERPITAEDEAEKPTRAPRARKAKAEAGAEAETPAAAPAEAEVEVEVVAESAEAPEESAEDATPAPPKKKTRRGSRGGRGRKKKPAAATAAASDKGAPAEVEAVEPSPDGAAPKIHVPDPDLGRESVEAVAVAASETAGDASSDGEAPKPKKRTRRGSRGGRNRKRKTAAAAPEPSAPAE